jgi:hypothetical protein
VKKLRRILGIGAAGAVLAAALAPAARAESSEGGAFRLPGYGARAWGMAGAVVARVDDESAVDWNPAGMSACVRSLGLSYVDLVPDASLGQSQAVFVMPLGDARDEGTGRVRHVGGAMFTHLSADVGDGLSYRENHLRLAYAFTPEPLVSVAIAGQAFLSSSGVAGFDAWGTSVDFAARLSVTSRWSFAAVGRDVFSRFSYDDGRDYHKETHYVVGLARQGLYGVDLEADVVYAYGDWTRALVGAETGYLFRRLALRGGLSFLSAGESRTAYAFGASVRAAGERLSVHYGASLDDEDAFGTTHRVSLGLRL